MLKLELIEKEDLKKIVEWNFNKSADYLLQWAGQNHQPAAGIYMKWQFQKVQINF